MLYLALDRRRLLVAPLRVRTLLLLTRRRSTRHPRARVHRADHVLRRGVRILFLRLHVVLLSGGLHLLTSTASRRWSSPFSMKSTSSHLMLMQVLSGPRASRLLTCPNATSLRFTAAFSINHFNISIPTHTFWQSLYPARTLGQHCRASQLLRLSLLCLSRACRLGPPCGGSLGCQQEGVPEYLTYEAPSTISRCPWSPRGFAVPDTEVCHNPVPATASACRRRNAELDEQLPTRLHGIVLFRRHTQVPHRVRKVLLRGLRHLQRILQIRLIALADRLDHIHQAPGLLPVPALAPS
mmetsp:Transcript_137215/g.438796  ORF Transcript_137215/g.438796 Transcript_137215/m.438796 type:complete len:296 (-) Transcript_137215:26-913(-)